MSPNLRAFLQIIAVSELTARLLAISDNGCNVLVGSTKDHSRLFSSYADHPRQLVDLACLGIKSTAAGRYQILARFFDAYKKQLTLKDFSPVSQNAIAVQMIRDCGALADIEVGRVSTAITKCRSRWASLPGAGYGQHKNSLDMLVLAFRRSDGGDRVNGPYRLLCAVLAAVALLLSVWFGVRHYVAEQRQAGYDATVADGQEARKAATVAALAIESGLRTRLLEQDTISLRKEQEHAESLESAQRSVRTGVDSLRCPARPIPGAAAGDRPAAAGPAADGEGPDLVPKAAAEILGDAADVGRILRNYDRVVERFEACRAVNGK